MKKYILFDHTADIGCEIFGKTGKELFVNSVAALFDLMLVRKGCPEKGGTPALEKKSLAIEGNDSEDLLINFLREALYLYNGEKWVVTGCEPVELTPKHIVAQLSGEPYNPQKHKIKTEIKAVTYHGLSVKRTKTGWKARVIFDV
jgi:SHS2 domain-containing protein